MMAERRGLSTLTIMRRIEIKIYVEVAINILRVQLISQALSPSTRLFLSLIFSISFAKFSTEIISHFTSKKYRIHSTEYSTFFHVYIYSFEDFLKRNFTELTSHLKNVSFWRYSSRIPRMYLVASYPSACKSSLFCFSRIVRTSLIFSGA